jgi:molybdopterin synthase catalytic subunit
VPAVRLLAVRESALSVDEVMSAVADPLAGGVALFAGAVRALDQDRPVVSLGYTAHPSAEDVLHTVAQEVVSACPVVGLAAVHRVGDLTVGDLAVVVAVSCPHRGEAFAAARQLIDEIKLRLPVWKHQRYADGGEEWVGCGVSVPGWSVSPTL